MRFFYFIVEIAATFLASSDALKGNQRLLRPGHYTVADFEERGPLQRREGVSEEFWDQFGESKN
ncbi:uncharacterized protein PITG_22938 [Phytophthora infestans T30-4]|uniref:Uncharacterized protein n=1 Tax=Phytophthora infestans (strain T30-4) TaxID=403677 RepID=D0NIW3_PHYIT|nr:uncharacterized protein PITG_22938 [Phytophthora infestans T30-4]EEY59447.1 conserved hypothetical protein [Phytophthora infestans T30-4]|eukprot:XP_002901057.1 conserved hypothetical protein [Phytophthora infestans T30-4]